jgi:hypothetical protein
MSKIKPIVLGFEGGDEYVFSPRRVFVEEMEAINQELRDIPEDGDRFKAEYQLFLSTVAKFSGVQKVVKDGFEDIDPLTEFASRTVETDILIRSAFNYFTNNQMPNSRFLDK